MKLSIETYAIRKKFGDKKALCMIKEAGFDCVDYSFYYVPADFPTTTENYMEYAKEIRAYMDELGLECNQAHAPFSLKANEVLDESNIKYLNITRSIEAAGVLGAKYIIVHLLGSCVDNDEFDDFNEKYLKSLEKYAAKSGVKIAVENLVYGNVCSFKSPEAHCEYVRKLGLDNFVACVDVGHLALAEYEPEDYLRRMDAEVLKSLHIQDNTRDIDRHMLPFTGTLHWEEIMGALKEIGYNSEITLEVFKYLRSMPDEITFDALKLANAVGNYLVGKMD